MIAKLAALMTDSPQYFLLFFMAPLMVAGIIAWLLYKVLPPRPGQSAEQHCSYLCLAAVTPLLLAVIHLMWRDLRDRNANTALVILTQVVALPLIPMLFLALRRLHPAQFPVVSRAATYVVLGLVCVAPLKSILPSHQKPWLIKE